MASHDEGRVMRLVSDGDAEPTPGGEPDSSNEASVLAALLSQCARGQEEAFADLYDRTSSRVHGVVLKVVRSPEHAAEVTQEAFLEIWRQSARFDPRMGSPLSWMITIAHRRAVDRVRSVVSDTARDETYGLRAMERDTDHVWSDVETRLEAERVRTAVETLTPIQREALQLAYFGGYTQTQISELLKLPLGTVKTRIRDGIIGLRDALGVERTPATETGRR